jgi:hypothetical protein
MRGESLIASGKLQSNELIKIEFHFAHNTRHQVISYETDFVPNPQVRRYLPK